MNRFFVIDTNVVVAGLITAQANSPVARILERMLGAAFAYVLSPALLAEYRAVLMWPKLVKQHGLVAEQVDALLTELVRHGIVLTPSAYQANQNAARAPDPGDQFLWDLLALRADLFLVTGDKRLLEDVPMQPRVITPSDLITHLHS